MDEALPAGSGPAEAPPEQKTGGGRVWSTGCLLVVLLAAFAMVVGIPALIWLAGILAGQ